MFYFYFHFYSYSILVLQSSPKRLGNLFYEFNPANRPVNLFALLCLLRVKLSK